ncbi:hypothetical protein DPMN_032366 [Dreissena polymorpha]|uniref:C2H2-type domain-containing protein n=1 Tax=Dreissena polymorpha TaxID=45954 RepID=A0A9D4RK67_DREPO|nr:hypothetical protein DPMN_032366 [Dreissena polymorpha]
MSKTRAGLLRHIRGHAHSGNYICCEKAFQCGRSFADKYLLVAREKSAKIKELVICYQCGLAVRSENDLREHVNTHMHDKCYSSEECFKTYRRKTNLSRYIYYYYYYNYY